MSHRNAAVTVTLQLGPPTQDHGPEHYFYYMISYSVFFASNISAMPGFGLNQGQAYIIVTATTGCIWSILVFLIRVFLRVKVNGPFGRDDYACAAATVFGIASAMLVLAEVHLGLGASANDISKHASDRIQLLSYIMTFTFILGISLSQISVCLLIARITSVWKQVWIAYGIAIASTIWAIVFIFIMAFRCSLPHPWDKTQDGPACLNQWGAWEGLTIIQLLIEAFIVKAALFLVWPLNMRKKPKIIVMIAFSVRLLIIPPASIRLKYIYLALYGKDWTHDRINSVIITQVVLHLSVILCTVPCIKPWLALLEGGGLNISKAASTLLPTATTHHHHNTAPPTRPQGVALDSIDRWQDMLNEWRPDNARTVTKVQHSANEALQAARKRSMDSSESSKHGIHRVDSFTIEYDVASDMSQHNSKQNASAEATRRSSRNQVQNE